MDTAFTFMLTAAASIFSGMILYFFQRYFKRIQRKEEERERAKAHQITLIVRTLNALGHLTVANSIALRDGHTNGELKDALKEYKEVEKDLFEYLAGASK